MFLALTICNILFILASLYVAKRVKLAFYHPLFIFLVWHFLAYVWVPWRVFVNGNWHVLTRMGVPLNTDYYLVKTILIVNLGFFCVLTGFYLRTGLRWAQKLRVPKIYINSNAAIMVILAASLIGLYSIFNYHPVMGFHGETFNPMEQNEIGQTIFTRGSGYLFNAYLFISGAGLLSYFVSRHGGQGLRTMNWVLILGYMSFNLFKGFHRAGWVLFFFGITTLHYLLLNRRWPSWKIIVLLIPLSFAFNMSGADRSSWRNILEAGESTKVYVDKSIDRLKGSLYQNDISPFEYNAFQATLYPEEISYELGRGYFNAWIVMALPRVIFKNKDQYMLKTNISQRRDVTKTVGLCSGFYFDIYRNFGPLGVVLGCLFFGVLLSLLWNWVNLYATSSGGYEYIKLIYAGLIMFLPQLLRDGLGSLTQCYFFIMTPILLSLIFSRNNNVWQNKGYVYKINRKTKMMKTTTE